MRLTNRPKGDPASQPFMVGAEAPAPALVLVWDRLETVLWDGRCSRLTEDLEGALGDVHISHTTVDDGRLLARHALRALHLVGATSAVVVAFSEASRLRLEAAAGELELPVAVVGADLEAAAVVRAYRRGCGWVLEGGVAAAAGGAV